MEENLSEFDWEDMEEIELFRKIYAAMKKYESGMHMIVPENVKVLELVYDVMCLTVKGENLAITSKIHKPTPRMGSIFISGRSIEILNPQLFGLAVRLSSGIEVGQQADGTIELAITFHNLARKVCD